MGLVVKRDEDDDLGGIEVIGRGDVAGDGPEGVDANPVELVAGESAENIAAGTTAEELAAQAEERMVAEAADEALMEGIDDVDDGVEFELVVDGDDTEDEGDVEDATEDGEQAGADPEEDGGEPVKDKKQDAPAKVDEPKETKPGKKVKLPANHAKLFCALGVALVIVAGVGGYALGHGGFGSRGLSSATLTDNELGTTVATWTYNGTKHDLTAQQAIEAQYSLDSAKDEDGNYDAPSADTILSYVRNQIMLSEAESRGISVTDDEMEAYAEQQLGTSDYATMASNYGVSEEQAKQIVKENCTLNKLYSDVTEDASDSDATAPEAPTEPENGDSSTASKDYADYIIKLAGDEWDSKKGAWASEDGPYYKALKDEKFTADSATYAQAQSAYYVAYQQYSEQAQKVQSAWSDFLNGLYAKADISIFGLYV